MAELTRDNAAGDDRRTASGNGARLAVHTVERLHRLLAGDARVEAMILCFIADRYGAKSLFELPAHVAREILKRPGDFIQAAKRFCEPELQF
jgi:hypothetical protein